jgi:hypothetical protein
VAVVLYAFVIIHLVENKLLAGDWVVLLLQETTCKRIPRWWLEGGSRKHASNSEILREAGDTACRQNHWEEAKRWPLHTSSQHRESPLYVKRRNQEGPWAASCLCPDSLGRRGQVLFYFMRSPWWDNYRTTSEAWFPELETEMDTKIIKSETSLHLNLEVFFFFLFFILFYFILFIYFFFHLLIFYFYSYLYSFYFLFSILSLSV